MNMKSKYRRSKFNRRVRKQNQENWLCHFLSAEDAKIND